MTNSAGSLPLLLIIDDIAGSDLNHRESLCVTLGLNDISSDNPNSESIEYAIADAVFTSSQKISSEEIVNDVRVAESYFSERASFSTDGRSWSMVLLDLRFVSGPVFNSRAEGLHGDDLFGLEILKRLQEINVSIPIIILSSLQRESVIEKCRRLGATDFMEKNPPENSGSLPIDVLKEKLFYFGLLKDSANKLVGCSNVFLGVLAQARRASKGRTNVLITGESGTGKELLANYIHNNSGRSNSPYYVFNAAGTTESLQQDQLFGHVKGAFTGANTDKKGLFELCDGGTLFIDEVGDISNEVQNQLLRPIENRTTIRQGDAKEIPFDVKVVLATNKVLDDMVKNRSFKHDLLNRIDTLKIEIPPLRKRKEDIPQLTYYMLEGICNEANASWPRRVTDDCMQVLVEHSWEKGNVRELRGVLERVVKNHPSSELLLASDLEIDIEVTSKSLIPQETEPSNIQMYYQAEQSPLPLGCWNEFQKNKVLEFSCLLNRALLENRKIDFSNQIGFKLNLSGTVSFLLGKKTPTVQAGDFIKRQLNVSKELQQIIFHQYPLVKEIYDKACLQRKHKKGKN